MLKPGPPEFIEAAVCSQRKDCIADFWKPKRAQSLNYTANALRMTCTEIILFDKKNLFEFFCYINY
jgi:hypothetical protein